jgi:hypothetical protein
VAILSSDDARLKAADLIANEFIGELEISGPAGFDLLEVLTSDQVERCRSLPIQPWLEPDKKDGYTLHFEFGPHEEPYVFAFLGSEPVGGMAFGDNITVKAEHQRRGIGKELCLAGHAQCSLKPKPRKVTEEGAKTIRGAYELVCRVAAKMRSGNCCE